MNTDSTADPNHIAIAAVHEKLSSKRRWIYGFGLALATIMLAIVSSLWLTEPRPLLPRLHIAFGAMTVMSIGWTALLSWILFRRDCCSVNDQIATLWMALACSFIFVVAFTLIAWMRGSIVTTAVLPCIGLAVLAAILQSLRLAYHRKSQIEEKLRQLGEGQS